MLRKVRSTNCVDDTSIEGDRTEKGTLVNHSPLRAKNRRLSASSSNNNKWKVSTITNLMFVAQTMYMVLWCSYFLFNHFTDLRPYNRTHTSLGATFLRSKPKKKTCITIAMLSRSTEFSLRDWQRNEFQQQTHLLPSELQFYKTNNVHIKQYFMVGINNQDDSVMVEMKNEQKSYKDVKLLRINEGYSHLTAHTWESFHQLLPEMEHPQCHKSYLIRADTDFVLHYKTLTQSILHLNETSTYFGLMVPNMPTTQESRMVGSTAQNFLPLWANGGLYGLSVDLVRYLTSDAVERTILKKEEGYIYPEEDRAIGLALARSYHINSDNKQTAAPAVVDNMLFTKKAFHMCASSSFTCDSYGDFMGFSVGFGLSGEGADRITMKLKELSKISKLRDTCDKERDTVSAFQPSDYLLKIDEKFEDRSPVDSFTYGCKITQPDQYLTDLMKDYSDFLEIERQEESEIGEMEKSQCAETVYRKMFPDIDELIQNGTYVSGREHYWNEGLTNSSLHYYCPRICNHDPQCKSAKELCPDGIGPNTCPIYERFQKETEYGDSDGCLKSLSTFINDTTPYVKKWPVSGIDQGEKLNPETCKAVVYIDGRDQEWMDYTLRTHRRYTGPDWMFYLIGPEEVTKKWRLQYTGPMVTIVDLPSQFGDLSDYPKQINDLYKSDFLWNETVKCEYVLVTQADALMLRHGIDDFLKYDWVGAPIYPESHPSTDWRLLYSKNANRYGGNGGFSLRRRSFVLKALNECTVPIDWEDVWYSACAIELGASLPSTLMANRFSMGSTCESDVPVGVHKLWQNCKESTCNEAIMMSALYNDIYNQFELEERWCPEGDVHYQIMNPDVGGAVRDGAFETGFSHWKQFGYLERKFLREYRCLSPKIVKEKNSIAPFRVNEKYFEKDF